MDVNRHTVQSELARLRAALNDPRVPLELPHAARIIQRISELQQQLISTQADR